MKILVTGANGQLGSEIRRRESLYPQWQFVYADLPGLDITDFGLLNAFISEHEIQCIINCAAYTAVDKAETDHELARRVNVVGPENLAKLSALHSLKFIHISTDFVFDGKRYQPYTEEDIPKPEGVYGATKHEGELRVLEENPISIIIRTSWLYSVYGNNFVKTMLRLGKERDEIRVIFDQIGTPTWAGDLAGAILQVLSVPEAFNSKFGIYHYSNEGVASWYDFAIEIMRLSERTCKVFPILTKQYPTPAARPHYSVLNKTKIKNDFGLRIPYWKDSLIECLKELEG